MTNDPPHAWTGQMLIHKDGSLGWVHVRFETLADTEDQALAGCIEIKALMTKGRECRIRVEPEIVRERKEGGPFKYLSERGWLSASGIGRGRTYRFTGKSKASLFDPPLPAGGEGCRLRGFT